MLPMNGYFPAAIMAFWIYQIWRGRRDESIPIVRWGWFDEQHLMLIEPTTWYQYEVSELRVQSANEKGLSLKLPDRGRLHLKPRDLTSRDWDSLLNWLAIL